MNETEILTNVLAGDIGDSRAFAQIAGGSIVYDTTQGEWRKFDGIFWQQISTEDLSHIVSRELRKLYLQVESKLSDKYEIESYYKKLASLHYGGKLKTVINLAQSTCKFQGQWDKVPHKIACKNGVINLMTGKLEAGIKDDYLTASIPNEYHESADCPRFKQFLKEIFNDDNDIIDFMQVLLGYGLIGESNEHVLPVLWGESGFNGKNILLRAITYATGDKVCNSVSTDVLLSTGNDKTTSAYQLKDLRIAYANETENGSEFSSAKVKELTGDSPVWVKQLYKDAYTIEPKYLLMLLTNFKPSADAIDEPLWERIILIPFSQRFVSNPVLENEHLIDVNLKGKLEKEKAGILNWLVQGATKYYDYGLQVPEKLRMSTMEYKQENDIFGGFIENCCTVDNAAKTLVKDLFTAFCNETSIKNGLKELRQFTEQLKKLGYEVRKVRNINTVFGLTYGIPVDFKSEKTSLDEVVESYLDMSGI